MNGAYAGTGVMKELETSVSPAAVEVNLPVPVAAMDNGQVKGAFSFALFEDQDFWTNDPYLSDYHSEVDGEFLVLTDESATVIFKCDEKNCVQVKSFTEGLPAAQAASVRLMDDGNFVMVLPSGKVNKFFRK